MKNTIVVIDEVLTNIAPRFSQAIWRQRFDGHIFSTYKEAREKGYNLKNCNYHFEDEDGNIIRRVNNAKLDGYGRRYN